MNGNIRILNHFSPDGDLEEDFPANPVNFDLTLMVTVGRNLEFPCHDYWVAVRSIHKPTPHGNIKKGQIILPFFSSRLLIEQLNLLIDHVVNCHPETWEYELSKFLHWEYD